MVGERKAAECPNCGKDLIMKKIPYYEEETGLRLDDQILFEAEVCESCNEIFYTEETSSRLDLIFMDQGLWGVSIPPIRENTSSGITRFIPFSGHRYQSYLPPKYLVSNIINEG